MEVPWDLPEVEGMFRCDLQVWVLLFAPQCGVHSMDLKISSSFKKVSKIICPPAITCNIQQWTAKAIEANLQSISENGITATLLTSKV